MKKIIFILIILVSTSIYAQDEAFKNNALKLMELSSRPVFEGFIDQGREMVSEGKKETFVSEAKASVNDLLVKMADVYMQEFTHEEIKNMISFYETPTGKKMAEKSGTVAMETMQLTQPWFMELQQLARKHSN